MPAKQRLVRRLVCCASLACIVAFKIHPTWRPTLSNDSYQYLSVADNLQHGLVGFTSLVHFDEERSEGMIPAPLTSFPMGYPLAIGVFQAGGLPGASAGMIVSLLSALGCVVLLDMLSIRFDLSTTSRYWVLAMFVANAATIRLSIAVLAETTFTLVAVGALVLLAAALGSGDNRRAQVGLAIAAGLAFGLSYWIRYAGLFLLLGLLPAGIIAVVTKRLYIVRPATIAFCVGGLVAAAGMIRNVLLVGTWRGGNTKEVHHAASQIAYDFGYATKNLTLGSPSMADWMTLTGLLLVLLGVGCAVGVVVLLKNSSRPDEAPARADFTVATMAIVAMTYLACIVYAAANSMISFNDRLFFPVMPLALVLVGFAITAIQRRIPVRWGERWWCGIWLAVAVVHAALHFSAPLRAAMPNELDEISGVLDRQVTAAATGRQVILSLTGEHGVVMSNAGQASGYSLNRPTISLVIPKFSSIEWTESNVRANMKSFAVKALVVYKPAPDSLIRELPSTFLTELGAGEVPSWLKKVADSEYLVIYRPTAAL
jgi:hypothetical protein